MAILTYVTYLSNGTPNAPNTEVNETLLLLLTGKRVGYICLSYVVGAIS